MAPLEHLLIKSRLEYISDLLAEQTVLVVGGHGWEASIAVHLNAADVLYIHPNAQRLRYVERRFQDNRIGVHQAPFSDTGIEDGCVDVILLRELPADALERRAALMELKRILSAQGFIYLTAMPAGDASILGSLLERKSARLEPAELRAELRRFFTHVEVLEQTFFVGSTLGPKLVQNPTDTQEMGPCQTIQVAICSELLIVPEEKSLTMIPLATALKGRGAQTAKTYVQGLERQLRALNEEFIRLEKGAERLVEELEASRAREAALKAQLEGQSTSQVAPMPSEGFEGVDFSSQDTDEPPADLDINPGDESLEDTQEYSLDLDLPEAPDPFDGFHADKNTLTHGRDEAPGLGYLAVDFDLDASQASEDSEDGEKPHANDVAPQNSDENNSLDARDEAAPSTAAEDPENSSASAENEAPTGPGTSLSADENLPLDLQHLTAPDLDDDGAFSTPVEGNDGGQPVADNAQIGAEDAGITPDLHGATAVDAPIAADDGQDNLSAAGDESLALGDGIHGDTGSLATDFPADLASLDIPTKAPDAPLSEKAAVDGAETHPEDALLIADARDSDYWSVPTDLAERTDDDPALNDTALAGDEADPDAESASARSEFRKTEKISRDEIRAALFPELSDQDDDPWLTPAEGSTSSSENQDLPAASDDTPSTDGALATDIQSTADIEEAAEAEATPTQAPEAGPLTASESDELASIDEAKDGASVEEADAGAISETPAETAAESMGNAEASSEAETAAQTDSATPEEADGAEMARDESAAEGDESAFESKERNPSQGSAKAGSEKSGENSSADDKNESASPMESPRQPWDFGEKADTPKAPAAPTTTPSGTGKNAPAQGAPTPMPSVTRGPSRSPGANTSSFNRAADTILASLTAPNPAASSGKSPWEKTLPSRSQIEGDDRPQDGELELLDALSPERLAQLPNVTQDDDDELL